MSEKDKSPFRDVITFSGTGLGINPLNSYWSERRQRLEAINRRASKGGINVVVSRDVKDIDISRALAIDGWMSERELTWLALQAREISRSSSTLVEIGTWRGRSARAIGDNLRDGSCLWCVDTYDTRSDLIDSATGGDIVFSEAQSNLTDLVARGRVLMRRFDSLTIAKLFSDSHLKADFVFIDGSHDYESVRDDIRAWLPLLRDEKSVICGHDYGVYGGVGKAVKEAFGNGYETVKGTSIWVRSTK